MVQSSRLWCFTVTSKIIVANEDIRLEIMPTIGRKDDVTVVVPYAIDVVPHEDMKLSGDVAHEDEKLIYSNMKDDEERVVVPLTFLQKWGATIMACCIGMLRAHG